jgi:hypothetical protein
MTGETSFSLASRITKPISLAALAVLALAAVALTIIRVGEAQVGAMGYVIIGIMAAIAAIALVLALTRPAGRVSMVATKGDFSPGEVGGDYSVGGGSSNKKAGTPVRGRDDDLTSTNVATEGSYSPGHVRGDYAVDPKPAAKPDKK